MNDQEKTITISQKEYDELVRRNYFLTCLEISGLNKIDDFWINCAIERYEERYPEEN